MEVVIDQKGEETVIKIKGRLELQYMILGKSNKGQNEKKS